MGRRSALLSVVVAVLAVVTAGCSSNEVEEKFSVGAVERNEVITAANVAIVTDGEGNAVLVGTLINDGEEADRLLDVDVASEIGPIEVDLPEGPVDIPVGEPVRLAPEPLVTLRSEELRQGFRAPVELVFESSTPISVMVTVEPHTEPYEDIEIPAG